MTSDYAKELGEVLDQFRDRLAELAPEKGKGSRRLGGMAPEDKRYVGEKARAAEAAIGRLSRADMELRMGDWVHQKAGERT